MRFATLTALMLLGVSLLGTAFATSPAPALPTGWKSWGGGWVRLEKDGNLSCLSFDAKNCAWENSVTDPDRVEASTVRPLTCGTAHRAAWGGVNGYNDYNSRSHQRGTRHWCRTAYATLFAKWTDYSTLGAKYWLSETPDGDAMCHSTDGKSCTTVAVRDSEPPQGRRILPLVCGAHLRRMTGTEGYDQPGHWCTTPKIHGRVRNVAAIHDSLSYLTTVSWVAEDEPAVIVRAALPPSRRLLISTDVLLVRPTLDGTKRMDVGGIFGWKRDMWAKPYEFLIPRFDPWYTGRTIFGFKVTPQHHLCAFEIPDDAPSGQAVFDTSRLMWNSRQVANFYGQRELLILSSIAANDALLDPARWHDREAILNTPRVMWMPDKGAEFNLDEVVVVAARRVPVENNVSGERRKISYAQGCDNKTNF